MQGIPFYTPHVVMVVRQCIPLAKQSQEITQRALNEIIEKPTKWATNGRAAYRSARYKGFQSAVWAVVKTPARSTKSRSCTRVEECTQSSC